MSLTNAYLAAPGTAKTKFEEAVQGWLQGPTTESSGVNFNTLSTDNGSSYLHQHLHPHPDRPVNQVESAVQSDQGTLPPLRTVLPGSEHAYIPQQISQQLGSATTVSAPVSMNMFTSASPYAFAIPQALAPDAATAHPAYPPQDPSGIPARNQNQYNIDLDVRNDTAILRDLFANAQSWGKFWAAPVYEPDDATMETLRQYLDNGGFTHNFGILNDRDFRAEVISSIVARTINYFCITEDFLLHCGHELGSAQKQFHTHCFVRLPSYKKPEFLAAQRLFFKNIHDSPDFGSWVEQRACTLAALTKQKLGRLLARSPNTLALSADDTIPELSSLFAGALRIGMRLRMSESHMYWSGWTLDSMVFDPNTMVVNTTKKQGRKHGQVLQAIRARPADYSVRWALSPVVLRLGVRSMEEAVVVNKSLVALKQTKF